MAPAYSRRSSCSSPASAFKAMSTAKPSVSRTGMMRSLSCASFSTSNTRGLFGANSVPIACAPRRFRRVSDPITQQPHLSTATSMTRPSGS